MSFLQRDRMATLTPTDERIYALLADGNSHKVEEVLSCLWDEMSSPVAVWVAISRLRAKLPRGKELIVHIHGEGYRLVRL